MSDLLKNFLPFTKFWSGNVTSADTISLKAELTNDASGVVSTGYVFPRKMRLRSAGNSSVTFGLPTGQAVKFFHNMSGGTPDDPGSVLITEADVWYDVEGPYEWIKFTSGGLAELIIIY